MQFDDELKNSVITGIRVYPSGEGVTTPWVDGVAVADFLTLTYVNVTFVGKDNQKLLEHYPVATLVHTNTVNRKCVAEFKMRFVPEKSYLSIPFIAGWGVDTYVAFGMQLVREGLFSPLEWVEKVTLAPATVANMLERWTAEAGWVLVDPELDWIVNKDNILSQGKNTPLINQVVKGKVLKTFAA